MVSSKEANAMADVLRKLQTVGKDDSILPAGSVKPTSSTRREVNEMKNILLKLQQTSKSITQDVITEAKSNPDVGIGMQGSKTSNGVQISTLEIIAEKKQIGTGLTKNLYHIIDTSTGNTLYKDLGLFESAMGIVKHMLYTHKESRIKQLVQFDASYVNLMVETFSYKTKLSQLNENSIKYDVTSAKYSNNVSKLGMIKSKIMSAI